MAESALADPRASTAPGVRVAPSQHDQRLARDIMARWEQMRNTIQLFAPDWDDISDLIAPVAPRIQRPIPIGQSRTRLIYDSTAMTDSMKLAAYLHGNITNQAIDWHTLVLRDEELREDQEVNAWLAAVNRHLLGVYGSSNFYQSFHTFFHTYSTFGTAALFIGNAQPAHPRALPGQVFTPLAHGSYGILDDVDERVRTLYRSITYTPLQALEIFNGNVSDKVRQMATRTETMDAPVQFLHACHPRNTWLPGSLNNKNFEYASVYLEVETQFINEEGGYREFPYAVARWQKLCDSPWGFGPGQMALPDARTLNAMKRLQIEMLALQIQPPFKQVHEGVLGNVRLEPLAVNVVRRPDDLTTLDINARPDLVQISQEDLRQSLHNIFFVSGLEGVPPPESGSMTAYEVAQRLAINARLMGPAYYRLGVEALQPLVDRCYQLEARKGRKGLIPPPPIQLLEAAARRRTQIDIEFENPLARAQKSTDVQGIVQIYQIAAQMVQSKQLAVGLPGPNVFDLLDDDVAIRRAAEGSGLPREMIRGAVAVARLRVARAEAEQQAQQQQQFAQTAASLKDVAPFIQTTQDTQRAA